MRSLVFFFLIIGPTFANDTFYIAPIERPLNDQEPEWPVELIKIHKEEYVRNRNASFCTRPTDMLDTVVLHHSETLPTDTAQDMNSYHLNRGTEADPWYMVAYSYVINSPYAKSSNPEPKVTEGRPLDIVGAHAGTSAFVTMNAEQLAMWNDGKITCGKENTEFKVDPILLSKGKIKANVTTLGVVIVGNYAPFSPVSY